MGSEKSCEIKTPKLPLFSLTPSKSQDQYSAMGMTTPPHHSTASIPFNWEEKPGKPRTRPTKAHYSSLPKNLELPPRLLRPSTTRTALLDGHSLLSHPHVGCRPIFHSSRFIMCREVSFDCDQKSLVLSKRRVFQDDEKASWRKTGFASKETNKKVLAKPRFSFLESIYEAVKQAIPSTRRSNNGKWQH